MPAYHPVFLAGDKVRIKPLAVIKSYCAPEWPLHIRLPQENLEFAETVVPVADPTYNHGGEVFYRLRGLPGYWHEACLEDPMLHEVLWEGYPRPSEHFTIEPVVENGRNYVVVKTGDGVECLRKLVASRAEDEAEKMREVAHLRHFVGFLDRYDFWCPFRPAPETQQEFQRKLFRHAFNLAHDEPLPNGLFTAEVLEALKEAPRYPVQRNYANKPYPACGAPFWQRSASDPKPQPQDRALHALCRFYIEANSERREALRRMFRGEESPYHFAHRLAVRALRKRCPEDIETGLVALSMRDLGDLGDRPMCQNALYIHTLILQRVAQRINADFSSMVERTAAISTPYVARELRHCLSHANVDSLPFDVEEFDDENGPTIGWKH